MSVGSFGGFSSVRAGIGLLLRRSAAADAGYPLDESTVSFFRVFRYAAEMGRSVCGFGMQRGGFALRGLKFRAFGGGGRGMKTVRP